MGTIKLSPGVIEVVGLSGTGKSTIARRISDVLKCEFIDFADLLTQPIGVDHDNILKWDPHTLNNRVKNAQDKIQKKVHRGETIVLETHVCPNIPKEGYRPTTKKVIYDRKTKGFVFIWCTYDDMIELRKTRGAERDSIEISRHQFELDNQATLATCITLASDASIVCFPCQNRPGFLEEVASLAISAAINILNVSK